MIGTAQDYPKPSDWPRPADDNGLGIHWTLDLKDDVTDSLMPLARKMKLKWVVVVSQSAEQTRRVAKKFHDEGIMVILRPQSYIDNPSATEWANHVAAMIEAGYPTPYIEVHNEPDNLREWKKQKTPPDYVSKWMRSWGAVARVVSDAGGLPGIQCLDQNSELRPILQALKGVSFQNKIWFGVHPYALNHPTPYPAYPFDKWTPDQIAKLNFDSIVHAIETAGPGGGDMDETILRHYVFANVFMQEWGYIPGILATEGGTDFGAGDDRTYPKIDEVLHAAYSKAWYSWFLTGKDSLNQQLPDWLLCACAWILVGDDRGWILHPNTIQAIADLPVFVRKFSPPPPPPPSMTLEETVIAEAMKKLWMPINDQTALYQFAQKHGLGYPQTDEAEEVWNNETYVFQVFSGGIVYVKKGDWGNVSVVSKP